MAETILITKQEYNDLKQKAKAFEKIAESENFSRADIAKILLAKKTRLLSEEEFFE